MSIENQNAAALVQAPESSLLEARFLEKLESVCEQFARFSLKVIPYTSASVQKFRSLSPAAQIAKLEAFEQYHEFWMNDPVAGRDPLSTVKVMKSILSKRGLRLMPGVEEMIGENDVVEVYTQDLTQLFRNMRFLEVCSYPLMDLYLYEFAELYRRPHVITEKLVNMCASVLQTVPPKTLVCDIPSHFLEEVFSSGRHVIYIDQKILSPVLNDQGEIMGVLGTLEANLVNGSVNTDGKPHINVTPLSH